MNGIISHGVATSPRAIGMHPKLQRSGLSDQWITTLSSTDGPVPCPAFWRHRPVFLTPGYARYAALSTAFDGMSRVRSGDWLERGRRAHPPLVGRNGSSRRPVVEVMLNHQLDQPEPRGDRWFTIDRRAVVDPVAPGESAELLLPMNGSLGPNAAADMVDGVVSLLPISRPNWSAWSGTSTANESISASA